MQETIDRNHDAWWYLHRTLGSSAKFVQGNIYDMPADLGTFDVTVVGAILLHLREPWGALSQAAQRTTETMIVTEPLQDDLDPPESNIMRFSPSAEHHLTNWWSIYPGAVVSMLERLGFGQTETTMHTQRHHLAHDIGERRHRAAHVHRRGAARSSDPAPAVAPRLRTGRACPVPAPTTVREELVVALDEHGPPEVPVDEGPRPPPRARRAARRRTPAGRAPPRTRGRT